MKIPFIKYAKLWYAITIIVVLLSSVSLFKYGLKYGIDFTGGSLLEVSFAQNRPAVEGVKSVLEELGLKDSVVQGSGETKFIVRTNFLTEDQHQLVLRQMREKFQTADNLIREERFETIGSAISAQLRQRAIWAIILVNLGIIAYMAYAFRKVSRPVASWKYGALAIVAQLHDVLVVLGVFAILGHFLGLEVGIDFVVAILTVIGFSVTDTIVVYDRIRENLLHHTGDSFGETINNGLNQTLMRSLNTTATVLLPLLALFFLGGSTIHSFALALLIGMASGAYSSIFVASPLLVLVERWQTRG